MRSLVVLALSLIACYSDAGQVFDSTQVGAWAGACEEDYLIIVDGGKRIQKCPATVGSSMPCTTLVASTGQSWTPAAVYMQRGLVINKDGDLVVKDFLELLKCDASGCGQTIAGGNGAGSGNNQFANYASDLIVDSAGNYYVADPKNKRIQKCPATASSKATVCTTAFSWGAYHTELLDITLTPDEKHLMAIHGNGHMDKCSFASGSCTALYESGITWSNAIEVAADGSIFIGFQNQTSNRVQKCPSTGGACTTYASFDDPGKTDLILAPNGDVIISVSTGHYVVRCNAGTCETLAGTKGVSGNGANQFEYPNSFVMVTCPRAPTTTTNTTTTTNSTTTTTSTSTTTTTTTTYTTTNTSTTSTTSTTTTTTTSTASTTSTAPLTTKASTAMGTVPSTSSAASSTSVPSATTTNPSLRGTTSPPCKCGGTTAGTTTTPFTTPFTTTTTPCTTLEPQRHPDLDDQNATTTTTLGEGQASKSIGAGITMLVHLMVLFLQFFFYIM